jgi:uncharacterized repeat protein (TIGR02543 family)
MATKSLTINGWRQRVLKAWNPSSGFSSTSSTPGVSCVISSPIATSASSYGKPTNNMYTNVISVTTPSDESIGSINQISITVSVARNGGVDTSASMYACLRTTYTDLDTSDTVDRYLSNLAGGSGEQEFYTSSSTYQSHTFSFSGNFSKGTTYYMVSYTKSSDVTYIYQAGVSGSVDYSIKTYSVNYYNENGSFLYSDTKTYGVNLNLRSGPSKSATVENSTFEIKGNANGGYFNVESTTSASITAKKIATTTYEFKNWNTSSSGNGTAYSGGALYTSNASVSLYVQYTSSTSYAYEGNEISELPVPSRKNDTPATYKVTFNANEGSCSTSTLSASVTRKYTFGGWATSASATSANAAETYTSAKTLYTYWSYTDTTANITLPVATRVGYIFAGWAESSSDVVGVTGEYTPTSDVTLYAIWEQDCSIVRYNDNGNPVMCFVYYNNNGSAVQCNVYYNNNGTPEKI